MSQTIEITGRSVEDAAKLAAQQLGVERDRLTVTVLEEIKGLFGKTQVRVRAEVAGIAAESPAAIPAKKAAGRSRAKSAQAAKEEPEATPVAEPAPAVPADKPRRASRTKVAHDPKVGGPSDGRESSSEEDEEDAGPSIVATGADAKAFEKLVSEILRLGGLDAVAKTKELNGRYVHLELDGRDVAYLVGKHGEVLNAFQYLLNVIGARHVESGARVVLDGNNYRQRREAALTHLAEQIAEQVKRRGEEAVLDALPAFERRIVHRSLQEYVGVKTYSEGEEPNRRVVIAPV
jgi:spoIIIJ-associated protein